MQDNASALPIEATAREELPLPGGRSLVVIDGVSVEVRSEQGDVQVAIALDGPVPVVTLSNARLELEAAETVAVKCKRFEVDASDHVEVTSGGELKLTAETDFRAWASMIWLN